MTHHVFLEEEKTFRLKRSTWSLCSECAVLEDAINMNFANNKIKYFWSNIANI